MSRPADAWGRVRLQTDLLAARYSAWPLAGAAVLLAGALGLAAASQALQRRIDADRSTVDALRDGRQRAPAGAATATAGQAAPAWQVLPPAARESADLRTLFDLARRRGLLVAQGEYLRPSPGNAALHSLQVTLPLAGSYPQLRRFCEDALRALPHLSIDQIGFERDAVASATLTARLRLSLSYRAATPAAATARGLAAQGPLPQEPGS